MRMTIILDAIRTIEVPLRTCVDHTIKITMGEVATRITVEHMIEVDTKENTKMMDKETVEVEESQEVVITIIIDLAMISNPMQIILINKLKGEEPLTIKMIGNETVVVEEALEKITITEPEAKPILEMKKRLKSSLVLLN